MERSLQYKLSLVGAIIALSILGCMSQHQRPTTLAQHPVTLTQRPTFQTQPPASNRPAVVWTTDLATEIEITTAKEKVVDQLKDPESARFGEFWALSGSNGKRSICGYVNAKNSYGGYTGKKMFAIVFPDFVIIEGSDVMDSWLPGVCLPRTVK